MAEGEKQQEGGWWSSWLNAAKEQTEKAFEMVSSDLAEFTNTMQSDTKKVVEKTKETLQAAENSDKKGGDGMKQSFYSLMEGITKVLTVEPEDTSPPRTSSSQPGAGIFDRAKARLRAIQVDTGTYLQEPSGAPKLYADWLKSFDIEAYKGQISELLVSMVEVRSLYTSLVPSEVSHQDFWRRYFYKVHQLEVDEARKQALMQRAERAQTHKEDSISWDEEGWDSGSEDVPAPKPSTERKETAASRLQPSDNVDETPDTPKVNTEHPEPSAGLMETVPDTEETVIVSSPDNKINDKLKDTIKDNNIVDKIEDQADRLAEGANDNDKHISEKIENSTVVKTVTVGEAEACKPANDTSAVKDKSESLKVEKAETSAILEKNKPVETAPNVITKKAEGKAECTESDTALTAETVAPGETEAKDRAGGKETCAAAGSDGEEELKTKVKGDMVVVGDRISPSSESSDNKESGDDWEQDFDDIPVTAEDLQAAHELANKLNMSASEYNTLTGGDGGEEDDWENWE